MWTPINLKRHQPITRPLYPACGHTESTGSNRYRRGCYPSRLHQAAGGIMNSLRHILWLYGFLALLAGPLLAAEYAGRVVGVSDGSGACNQLQMK